MCVGEECVQYSNTIAYTCDIGKDIHACIGPVVDGVSGKFPIHGHNCVGHVESDGMCTFMHTSMTTV